LKKNINLFHKWKLYYKSQCKECINFSRKEYHKNYRIEKSKEIKERNLKYKEENPTKLKQSKKKWSDNNPKYYKSYQSKRLKNDPLFKFSRYVRAGIRSSIKRKFFKKYTKSSEILGCSFESFKEYIESKFESWMNWDNYGKYNGELYYGWDLDHIIPTSTAKSEEDIIKLNHYTNFQPLCSKTNRYLKKNKLEYA